MLKGIRSVFNVAIREVGIWRKTPIYLFCMVVFPLLSIFFFTSMLQEGQPENLPCGVIDEDNSTTSRTIVRNLDALQSTQIVARYANFSEAKRAIQRNEIYAFLHIPKATSTKMIGGRQPSVAFYYSNVSLVAGSLLFKDLKTITTLSSAAMGIGKLKMIGKTDKEISAYLQPITLDVHPIGNPYLNYNVYLTTFLVPGVLMLFMFLVTVYSIGTEMKFQRSKEWLAAAKGNIFVALLGKLLPQFLVFLTIFIGYEWYVYDYLNFPHAGGVMKIFALGVLSVLSAQGFGAFVFGLIPTLRMALSICSLWAMVGFSACGATFPVFAMNPMIEGLAQIIPLRHYYMIYQVAIFNGYPLHYSSYNLLCMVVFASLPIVVLPNMKKAMMEYEYLP